VKAGIWVLVEKLHAAGLTLTYEGPVKSSLEVVYCLVVVGMLFAHSLAAGCISQMVSCCHISKHAQAPRHAPMSVPQVCCLDYLHDSWFYLTHRLLHWAPLYRHVHYIHHK
jgi:sterol desaturase/sphingolipid hydroxylase (fatty acid hydroxylase superfamily)